MMARHKKDRKFLKLPRVWLMTDPRLDNRLERDDYSLNRHRDHKYLEQGAQSLPFGSGIIFRHYHLDSPRRRSLFRRIRRIGKRRGHIILLAGSERDAIGWRADGFHGRSGALQPSRHYIRSAPVHDTSQIAQARRKNADMMFVSPVFATRSHPGKKPLGLMGLMRLARLCGGAKVIALGGMNRNKAMSIDKRRIHGWAAIDGLRKMIRKN